MIVIGITKRRKFDRTKIIINLITNVVGAFQQKPAKDLLTLKQLVQTIKYLL